MRITFMLYRQLPLWITWVTFPLTPGRYSATLTLREESFVTLDWENERMGLK